MKLDISGRRMFGLLRDLDYTRLSTTEGEKKGADVLINTLREMGAAPVYESFKAPAYTIHTARLEVLKPVYREYTVTGYGFSGCTSEDGLIADFAYVEVAEDIDLVNAKGKIVLLSGGANYQTYERLVKAGVAGFIGVSGDFADRLTGTDLDERMLRAQHIVHGKIPGVCLRMSDAITLVRSHPDTVRITLDQTEGEGDSGNVIVDIPGTEKPEEVVVYTAHYDSVVFSHGIFDNAAGSAILTELCRHFLNNPPKRTVRFIWCGSEERGLLGSKAYIAAHPDKLEAIRLCINVDLAGPVIGRDTAIVVAEDKLCSAIEYMYKELGHPMNVRQDIYSSDSIPFADAGIPGVNFVRFGAPGAAACHNRRDVLTPISGASLAYTATFIAQFSERTVNAYMFPVSRELPQVIVDKVNKYLLKTK